MDLLLRGDHALGDQGVGGELAEGRHGAASPPDGDPVPLVRPQLRQRPQPQRTRREVEAEAVLLLGPVHELRAPGEAVLPREGVGVRQQRQRGGHVSLALSVLTS